MAENDISREEFLRILEILHKEEIELHKAKGQQYSPEGNTLSNFVEGGKSTGLSPRYYCLVLMEKHRQALLRNALGDVHEELAVIRERVRDIRLYTALYYGLSIAEDYSEPLFDNWEDYVTPDWAEGAIEILKKLDGVEQEQSEEVVPWDWSEKRPERPLSDDNRVDAEIKDLVGGHEPFSTEDTEEE